MKACETAEEFMACWAENVPAKYGSFSYDEYQNFRFGGYYLFDQRHFVAAVCHAHTFNNAMYNLNIPLRIADISGSPTDIYVKNVWGKFRVHYSTLRGLVTLEELLMISNNNLSKYRLP